VITNTLKKGRNTSASSPSSKNPKIKKEGDVFVVEIKLRTEATEGQNVIL